MEVDLKKLETENQNVNTMNIDTCTSEEIVTLINNEDATVAESVRKQLPQIARLVDVIVEQLEHDRPLRGVESDPLRQSGSFMHNIQSINELCNAERRAQFPRDPPERLIGPTVQRGLKQRLSDPDRSDGKRTEVTPVQSPVDRPVFPYRYRIDHMRPSPVRVVAWIHDEILPEILSAVDLPATVQPCLPDRRRQVLNIFLVSGEKNGSFSFIIILTNLMRSSTVENTPALPAMPLRRKALPS